MTENPCMECSDNLKVLATNLKVLTTCDCPITPILLRLTFSPTTLHNRALPPSARDRTFEERAEE